MNKKICKATDKEVKFNFLQLYFFSFSLSVVLNNLKVYSTFMN